MSIERQRAENVGGREGFNSTIEERDLNTLRESAADYTREKPELAAQMKNILKSVNFPILREVFAEQLRKSNVPRERFNFVNASKVFCIPISKNVGSRAYYDEANAIGLDAGTLEQLILSGDEAAPYAFVIRAIAHEEGHATGSLSQKNVRKARHLWIVQTPVDTREGFRNTEYDKEGHPAATAFELFEEGIVCTIEVQTAGEYLRRNPITLPSGAVLNTNALGSVPKGTFRQNHRYPDAYAFMHRLAQHISDSCQVPTETVLDAFLKAHYDGSGFFAPENRELLDTVVGPEFLASLSSARSSQDLRNISEQFQLRPLEEPARERIRALFAM